MTGQDPVPRLSPELRTTVFYFCQFMSGAAATVFAGIWFSGKGLDSEQIGIVNATPVLAMLAINLVVGRIADRAKDWRQTIVAGAVISGAVPVALFFVDGFWGILLVWTLTGITQAAIVPVVDAAAMRITRRRGSDFGVIRAWGSIGFVLVLVATGYLVVWFGGTIFVPLFVALGLLRGLTAFGLPNFRAPRTATTVSIGATRLLQVMKPWFLLPLFGWSMVYATHLALNGFQSLLWSRQGIPADIIGVLIALGALSEAAMFFGFRRFAGRFPARSLILFSSVVAVVRWIAMAFSPGIGILVALQLLHSVSYALGFLGCMNFIANWTSEDIAAEAQSFFVLLQQITAVVVLTAFGWLVADFGVRAYLGSAVFAAAGGLLVWISIRLSQPKSA